MKKLLSMILVVAITATVAMIGATSASAETTSATTGVISTLVSSVPAEGVGVIAETTVGMTEITQLTEVPDGYTCIYTKADLNAVRNNLNGNYVLMTDIEFTIEDFTEGGDFYNGGSGWMPVGDSNTPFTGTFDGNGYAIKKLYVNISASSNVYAGLFGCNDGSIKNLGMEDSVITVSISSSLSIQAYAGGIAGGNYDNGTITNCYNTGEVSAAAAVTDRYAHACAGGIVGNSDGTISSCYNIGEVSATATGASLSARAGGIVGGW